MEEIRKLYLAVSDDVAGQIEHEDAIFDAYSDFRFGLKQAEIMATEVLQKQEANLETARQTYAKTEDSVKNYAGSDAAEKSRLQLTRDEAKRAMDAEDAKYQLIKDVAENLSTGYNVGETLVAKLSQTHALKNQIYRRAITFFTTNEHVFTTMDALYSSQHGLHEATQTIEAMKEGGNKSLEDIAELSGNLEKAALKAGYGSTFSPQSVQKLVDAIVSYQEESIREIQQYRQEATQSAKEIDTIVEEGKEKAALAVQKAYSVLALPPGTQN